MNPEEEKNLQLAIDFISALRSFDYDEIASYLSEDAHYRNHPFPASNTKESSIRQLKLLFTGMQHFNPRIIHIAATGDTVLMERYEIFEGKWFHIEFPVNGILRFRNGKIYEWRDHFDILTCLISSLKSPFIVVWKKLGGIKKETVYPRSN